MESDLQELEININTIKKSKKAKLKKDIQKIILNKSVFYLQNIKSTQSKLENLVYTKLQMQKYLLSSKLTEKEKSLLLKLRTRIIDVKDNFKNMYPDSDLLCSLNCGEYENQQHLLDCPVLIDKCEALYEDSTVQYSDLFRSEPKQLDVVRLYSKVLNVRENLLENTEN